MNKGKIVGIVLAALMVLGGSALVYHYLQDDDKRNYRSASVDMTTNDGKHYCVTGKLSEDHQGELYVSNCGEQAVRLHLAYDKNDRSKAKLYQPDFSGWIKLKHPDLTVYVTVQKPNNQPAGMSFTLPPLKQTG